MYFSGLLNTCQYRVVYGFGFQILFGEAFKCIHDKWCKSEIVGLCQGMGVFSWVLMFVFLVLAILEFKVWGRSEMSFMFYVLKMDYSLYVWIFYFVKSTS